MSERKEKFMPGPWYIKPREAYVTCLGIAYSRTTILDKPDGQYSPRHVIAQIARGNGREEANAALIAAAPEMYEIIAKMEQMAFNGSLAVEDIQDILFQAIHVARKARGEA